MKCALVSLDQQWQAKLANLERCALFTAAARETDCDLVIFPEMTLTGYSLEVKAIVEQEAASDTLVWFGELAKQQGIAVVFGACLLQPGRKKPSNAFCLALPDGTSRVLYEKIHPFSFAGEDAVFGAGSSLGFADIQGTRVGATICYDLRFPEIYSAMAPLCDVVITIANWPAMRVDHWRTLLQSRAIENQCYAIGVNRIGTDGNGLVYEKSSMIVSPEGRVLKPVVAGEELDIYEIDRSRVAECRKAFPTVQDKRYSLYRTFLETLAC